MDAKTLTRRMVDAVMGELNCKRPELARRIGVSPRQIDRWLRPSDPALMPTDVVVSIVHGEAGLPVRAREAAARVLRGEQET